MGIPLACKMGKHEWTSPNPDGLKTCKICRKINDPRPKRCKIDVHSWKKNQAGKKVCKFCGKSYSDWKEFSTWNNLDEGV